MYFERQTEVGMLANQSDARMSDRQILINLIAGLSLAEKRSDTYEDAIEALKQAGIPFNDTGYFGRESHWTRLARWLAKEHDATTLWGTELGG